MLRDLSRLTAAEHDVLVVGGGIYGLATAYDAAQRGLSVTLIDRADLGGATSFNHLKTIHGGLRYLQSADFLRMRESVRERRAFARIAPHLVSPLGFLTPTFPELTRSRLAIGAALLIDALVAADRNVGLKRPQHLQSGRLVTREECLRLFDGVAPGAITGGALWYDYQMPQADRLTLGFALAADAYGAALANYAEAVAPLQEGSRVCGVRARDVLGDNDLEIRARLTVNATGPWAADLIGKCGIGRTWPMLKAMNLVTKRPAGDVALVAPTRQGRALVLAPWQGRAIVGTGESSQPCAANDQEVTSQELRAFVEEVNETFPALRLEHEDISLVHRGVVPATVRHGRLSLQGRSQIFDHAQDGLEGLVSVIGVKYTTARAVAERTVDLVMNKLGRAPIRCRTAATALPGGELDDAEVAARELMRSYAEQLDEQAARHLVATYGARGRAVMELVVSNPMLGSRVVPTRPVLRAEVLHAARIEMACTLTDVVVRRTVLGSAGYPGDEGARVCAELLRSELGWSDARMACELEALRRFYAPIGQGK